MARVRKVGFVYKVIAVVIAAAIVLYKLLRRVDNDSLNIITDKVANVFLPGSISDRIYQAALQRLSLKFTSAQAAVLSRLMVAQSKYETANYTSHVLQANKNAFGYKYYRGSIYQIGIGTPASGFDASGNLDGGTYGLYRDVADSAREVADWIGRRKADFINADSPTMYAVALDHNDYYGEDVYRYAAGLQKYMV